MDSLYLLDIFYSHKEAIHYIIYTVFYSLNTTPFSVLLAYFFMVTFGYFSADGPKNLTKFLT